MSDQLFTGEQTGFWGAVALSVAAYFKYLAVKASKKETSSIMNLANKGVNMSEEQVVVKKGIEETKEVLVAAETLALFIISKVKDGVQPQDGIDLVTKLLMDSEFKGILSKAIENIAAVPEEIKDLDALEIFELGKQAFNGVPKFIEALKK